MSSVVADNDAHDAGFAAIDALVGLTILTVTLCLSLHALDVSRKLAASALEMRRAGAVLGYLMDSSPNQVGERSGVTDGFAWRLVVALEPADAKVGQLRLCRWSAEAAALRSRRRYHLATRDFCRPTETAP